MYRGNITPVIKVVIAYLRFITVVVKGVMTSKIIFEKPGSDHTYYHARYKRYIVITSVITSMIEVVVVSIKSF